MKRLVSVLALLAGFSLAACGGSGGSAPPATPQSEGQQPAAVAPPEAAPAAARLVTQSAQPQELVFPDGEAFRLEQPKAEPPRQFQLPQVKSFTLEPRSYQQFRPPAERAWRVRLPLKAGVHDVAATFRKLPAIREMDSAYARLIRPLYVTGANGERPSRLPCNRRRCVSA